MLNKAHVILPEAFIGFTRNFLPKSGWGKGLVLAVMALALPLCLSGSCKVSIQFSGQSALAATQEVDKDYRNVAEMEAKEKNQYTARLRKHITRDKDFMMKMRGQDIDAVFGAPDLVRRDGEIVSFHYKSDDCLMDVYVQGSEEPFAPVVHYEFRSRKTASMNFGNQEDVIKDEPLADAQPCLQQMVTMGQDYVVAAR